MFYVYVYNKKGEMVIKEVDEDVHTYVRQLEGAVKYPEISKIKNLYKTRFLNEH